MMDGGGNGFPRTGTMPELAAGTATLRGAAAGGFFGGVVAGVGNKGEVFEEGGALAFGEDGEDFALEFEREGADVFIGGAAAGKEADGMGAAVFFMFGALDEAIGFHAFEEAGDGVGIAADEFGEGALGEPLAFVLDEGAEDGELVGGDAGVVNAAAKGLVESIPAAPEQGRQAAASR